MTPDKEQTMSGEELADALERYVEVDESGERFQWLTAGHDITAREAMLEAARRLRRGGGVDTWWVHLPSIEKAEEAVREVRAGRAEDEVTHGLDVAITLLSRLALEARRASLTPTPTSEKEQTMGGEWTDEELADHISESEGDCPMCAEAARRLREGEAGRENVVVHVGAEADQKYVRQAGQALIRRANEMGAYATPPQRRRTMTKPDYTEELAKRLDHIQAELDNLAYELFGVNRYEEVPKFFSRVLKRARRVEEMTEHDRS